MTNQADLVEIWGKLQTERNQTTKSFLPGEVGSSPPPHSLPMPIKTTRESFVGASNNLIQAASSDSQTGGAKCSGGVAATH